MPVTSSLLAFILIGVAAAGVLPEIAVRDGTVVGQDGLALGFLGLPNPTSPPLLRAPSSMPQTFLNAQESIPFCSFS